MTILPPSWQRHNCIHKANLLAGCRNDFKMTELDAQLRSSCLDSKEDSHLLPSPLFLSSWLVFNTFVRKPFQNNQVLSMGVCLVISQQGFNLLASHHLPPDYNDSFKTGADRLSFKKSSEWGATQDLTAYRYIISRGSPDSSLAVCKHHWLKKNKSPLFSKVTWFEAANHCYFKMHLTLNTLLIFSLS